jgi:putative transposase
MVRRRKPPSQNWRAFLEIHAKDIVSVDFVSRVKGLGIEQVVIAARSPWQRPYVERVIGSIRRGCLDHVIVLSEKQLRRLLRSYSAYYHRSRTHLGLEKDCPETRPVEPPYLGVIRAEPRVGGLHRRYSRHAA